MGRLTQFARDHVREQLEEYIETNHLSAHSALPSERTLCEIFSAKHRIYKRTFADVRTP